MRGLSLKLIGLGAVLALMASAGGLTGTAGLGLTASSALSPGELRLGTDCQTIQECINKAQAGDTVTAPPGIYRENVSIPVSITLKGAGPDLTLLLGEAEEEPTITVRTRGVTIEGWEVRGAGDGVLLEELAQVTLKGSLIRRNAGHGVRLVEDTNAILQANRFEENNGCGVFQTPGAEVKGSDNVSQGNHGRLTECVDQPDLMVSALKVPRSVYIDDPIRLTVQIASGEPPVSGLFVRQPTGGFRVGFYLSEQEDVTTEHRLIGTRTVSLLPGAVETLELSLPIPNDFRPSTFRGFLGVFADDQDAIAERNEGNNRAVQGFIFRLVPEVLIPAGSFQMGDSFSEGGSQERPVHAVYVSAFYMDVNDVTVGLWNQVVNWAASHGYDLTTRGGFYNPGGNYPVTDVSWYKAVKWANARSEMEGLTSAYYTDSSHSTVYRSGNVDLTNDGVNWGANGYRLPTEAEWEKAARGGLSGQRYPWGNDIDCTKANYAGCGVGRTTPVGSYPAGKNGYGLYDMAGNVSQWVWDWYDSRYYSNSPGTDPRGPASGSVRVHRGGSWYYFAYSCRVANRSSGSPGSSSDILGFRLARTAP